MPTTRIIKKYPNRRLYDTEVSRYITVADVRDLVMHCVPLRVVDTANDSDITRAILLQIMLEEESGGQPLFSATMLAQIIRFYGGTLQGLFTRYLEDSLDLFAKQQQQMQETWCDNPLEVVTRTTQRNVVLWADLQQDFLRAAGFPLGSNRDQAKDKPKDKETDKDKGTGR
ncbi:MAG TPA: polyhydroxyalkanoate synthesis repressor PhaR [Chromatiaceae bacterium]|nr:polyhydroxyalkanoate synthesis repressor PhaR [Chromatiaceae bacterium]